MQTSEFLRSIFPLQQPQSSPTQSEQPGSEQPGQYIRFILISPSTPWPGRVHWVTVDQLHNTNINPSTGYLETLLGVPNFNNTDVYFTPHTFTRPAADNKVTKEDASPQIQTLWVECDDQTLDPTRFKPEPSLIVETSPGRHHVYWLLQNPIPTQEVEAYNRRLIAANALEKDKSGWHLVKLMRVPNTTSYKRPSNPTEVKIITGDEVTPISSTLRRYPAAVIEEALSHVSDPGTINFAFENITPPAPPLPTRAQILEKYPDMIPHEIIQILDTRAPDRSSALWRAYKTLSAFDIAIEDAYALLLGTANDKFSEEWRYNGEVGLWRDIQRGYAATKEPADSTDASTPPSKRTIKEKLNTIRSQKGQSVYNRQLHMAKVVFNDLIMHGRIYFNMKEYVAYYYDGIRTTEVDPNGLAWKYLMSRYGLLEGTQDYRIITSAIWGDIGERGESITPYRFSHYDAKNYLLYVYNNRGKVYRLDGQSIDTVDNGTDGIFFLQNPDLDEFWPDTQLAQEAARLVTTSNGNEGRGGGLPGAKTLDDYIFGNPNFSKNPEYSTRILRYWLYSVFFPALLRTRPHMVVTGPAGSGKTLTFQLIQNLLQGPGKTVSAMPLDRQSFETAASNKSFMFFDNVDTPNKWFTDALAEAATGISFTRRVLYTTNDLVTVYINCFIALTTRDVWFSRPDVAQRVIVLHTAQREQYDPAEQILDAVDTNRNLLWAMLLADLNRILATIKQRQGAVDYQSEIRMADFARFIDITADAENLSQSQKVSLIELTKSSQEDLLESGSIVATMLDEWLHITDANEIPKNLGRQITPQRLRDELMSLATLHNQSQQFEQRYRTTQSLIMALQEIRGLLDRKGYDLTMSTTTVGHRSLSFTLKDGSKNG